MNINDCSDAYIGPKYPNGFDMNIVRYNGRYRISRFTFADYFTEEITDY